MRSLTLALVLPLAITACVPAWAQFQDGDAQGAKLGPEQVQRWRAGVQITAIGGPCKSVIAYIPVPVEWPEQQVKIVAEDVSPGAKVSYQTVDQTVQVMVVRVGQLADGGEAKALVTFDLKRGVQLPPENKAIYQLPDMKGLNSKLRPYVGVSPKIESRDPKIRALAKEIIDGKENAWDKVEAIYDTVRQKVEYKTRAPMQGAAGALKAGVGSHEDLTSLFIALCRAVDIPARTVWVPEHCYPEFYLVDDKGEGHWFPCQVAGSRAFGEMPDTKPILAKGDNFRPPWNLRDHQRYLAEWAQATGGGRPRVKFVREKVAR